MIALANLLQQRTQFLQACRKFRVLAHERNRNPHAGLNVDNARRSKLGHDR
jgi:hypothetical protein